MKLKVVVASYNAHPWIEKCLESIVNQTYKNFDVCIVDDASTQSESKETVKKYAEQYGWLAIYNDKNLKQLPNVMGAIKALDCQPEDVIVIVDGDDWLFNNWVFEKIAEIYQKENNIWMTHGQYIHYQTGILGCCGPAKKSTVRRRSYRKKSWRYSHLKTFKSFLFDKIQDEDFRDAEGNYYGAGWDVALMFPMVEMARHHVRFVPQILYVYNDANPLCDFRVNADEQKRNNLHIRSRKKYPVIR